MLIQIFGVTNKQHYGMLWYFLEWSIHFQIDLPVPLTFVERPYCSNHTLSHCLLILQGWRSSKVLFVWPKSLQGIIFMLNCKPTNMLLCCRVLRRVGVEQPDAVKAQKLQAAK